MKKVLLLLVAGALLSGCASTIEDRRKERLAAYAALPGEQQSLVDTGRIKVGMPKDAVYIAWGKPDRVIQGESSQGATESWVYYGSYLAPYRYWNYGGYYAPYHYRHYYYHSPMPYMDIDWYPEYYVSGEVHFQNDRVAHWRAHPGPPY